MKTPRFFGEGPIVTVPRPAQPAYSLGSFLVCPMAVAACGVAGLGGMHEIYRMAYEQAMSSLTPSWYERVFVACPN
jgi:hypothetical protein